MNNSSPFKYIGAALGCIACMWAGVYLCVHDFPRLGGWVCILSVLTGWAYTK